MVPWMAYLAGNVHLPKTSWPMLRFHCYRHDIKRKEEQM